MSLAQPISAIKVNGSINPASSQFLLNALEQAQKQKHQALIVELNTPGGLLSSTREMIQAFNESSIPVIFFVYPGGASATSAGAILTISSHWAAMTPGTNIGAAHPVGAQGDDVKGHMGDKVTNDTAALVRSQALLRGRDPKNSELLVTKSLSHTENEALEKKLIDSVSKDYADLLKALHGKKVKVGQDQKIFDTADMKPEQIEWISMSPGLRILHGLSDPNISTLLLSLAGIAIYAEISSGFTLLAPGVFGIIALILAFISLSTLPIQVGSLGLMIVGVVLLIAEAFVMSFGLLGLAGLGSLVLGTLFLIDPSQSHMFVSWYLLGPLVAGIAIIFGITAWVFSADQKKRKGILQDGLNLVGQVGEITQIGAEGLTVKVLGELWKARSQEELAVGDLVRVQNQNGLIIDVLKKEKAHV